MLKKVCTKNIFQEHLIFSQFLKASFQYLTLWVQQSKHLNIILKNYDKFKF